MSPNKTLLCALLFFISCNGLAADLSLAVPIYKGESMTSARAALLKAGWIPRKTFVQWGTGTFSSNNPEGQEFVQLGYTEIEYCAADGPWCNLNYTDSHHDCLVVTTKGEDPKAVMVDSWRFTCPDNESLGNSK